MQKQKWINGTLWTGWISSWILILSFGLSLAHSAEAQSEAVASAEAEASRDFSDHIVWANGDPARSLFIPARRVQATERTSLPVHPNEIAAIEESLQANRRDQDQVPAPKRRFENDSAHCTRIAGLGTSETPFTGARPLAETLARHHFSGVGRVLDIVEGVQASSVQPVTVVYVEVEEILSCSPSRLSGRRLAPGDVVAILSYVGRVVVDGIEYCDLTQSGLVFPKIGERALVAGSLNFADPYYSGPGLIFPVQGNEITPQPYRLVTERKPLLLTEIRETLRGPVALCEEVPR